MTVFATPFPSHFSARVIDVMLQVRRSKWGEVSPNMRWTVCLLPITCVLAAPALSRTYGSPALNPPLCLPLATSPLAHCPPTLLPSPRMVTTAS